MSSTKGDSIGLLQSLSTVTAGTSSATITASAAATASLSSKVLSTTNWFVSEIQQMMYGFGDCRRSLHESAVLVEEIVHQQMGSLLVQASDVAIMRNSRFVGLEEMLFLLRKDKVKLRRLLRYLELKDLKVAALKGTGLDEDDPDLVVDAKPQIMKRRLKMCHDFLASIDQTGELVALFDDQNIDTVKHERMMRAELMSRNLDPQQYKEFCESRQANFSRRYKSQRFKDWLMAGVNVDIKPNPQGLEVISYLAYETVAQIVDLALIVKQEQRVVQWQPEKRVMAPVQHNYHDLQLSSILATQAKAAGAASTTSPPKMDSMQSPPPTPTTGSGQTPTPSSSTVSSTTSGVAATTTLPPSSTATASTTANTTSTTPSSSPAQGGATPLTSPALCVGRSNKKKRKRSGPATTLDTSYNSAITPGDIREAMRRYYEDVGPFASCTKVRRPSIARTRLLCA